MPPNDFRNPPGRSVSLTETPEFKSAVADAVAAALPQLAATMAAASVGMASPEGFAEKLAAAIADLTDQGIGQPKRVPPDIILARAEADKHMRALMAEAAAADQVPTYRLVGKIVVAIEGAGETLVDPLWRGADNRVYPTVIGWRGIPNLAMEAENDWAKKIMAAFRASIGNQGRQEAGVESGLALSPQGHVVSGGAASLIASRDRDRAGPGSRAGLAMVQNDTAQIMQQHGAAPYVDIRVLGTIAPPARQNG